MTEVKFDRKLKHLEFIQNVITRMNTNSFMIKGWAVTLVAALFALSDKTGQQHLYLIAFIPVPLFWILDGFFLATERSYRDLYNKVSGTNEVDIDFNMNPYHDVNIVPIAVNDKWYKKIKKKFINYGKRAFSILKRWLPALLSITLILFYGVLLVVMFVVKSWLDV